MPRRGLPATLSVVHCQRHESALSLLRHPSGWRLLAPPCAKTALRIEPMKHDRASMVTIHLAQNRAPTPITKAGSSSQADPDSFCRAPQD